MPIDPPDIGELNWGTKLNNALLALEAAIADAAASAVQYVEHGSVPGTARPAGAGMVVWIGDVQPTNMAGPDLWVSGTVVSTTPGAPTNLLATPAAGSVALSWTPPVSDGGQPITDYVVQYKTSASSTWLTFPDTVSDTTSVTVTGLSLSTAYDFRVATVNSVGTGSYSAQTTATTLGITTLATDNFNRADTYGAGNTLGTSSGGQTWIADMGGIAVQSNQARAAVLPGGEARSTIDAGTADVTVSAKMSVLGFGLILRMVATNDFHRVVYSGGTLYLQQRGSATGQADATWVGSVVDGDTISAVMSGTSIIVKVNGTTRITATRSAYSSGTKHGLMIGDNIGRVDDFSITTP